MEHRIGSRTPANLEAEIYRGGKKLGVFVVKNIGDSGLCVENRGDHLQTDHFLHVIIKSSRQSSLSSYSTNALVVWTSGAYAGLLRADRDTVFSQLIQELPASDLPAKEGPDQQPKANILQNRPIIFCDNKQAVGLIPGGVELATSASLCHQCCTRRACIIGRLIQKDCLPFIRGVRHPKPLHKNDRLFIQGDSFYSLYFIRSGSFKSCIIDDTGDRQITGFYFSGDILGMDGIETGRHLYEVEALETASVCTLPFNLFDQVSGHRQDSLYRQLIGAVSSMAFRDSYWLMVLGRMHAEQRLASFLLEISQRMADRGKSKEEFNLTMARYDIANYLGLAVETVSRLFRRFQEDRLIAADRHCVRILDRDSLEDIVASDHRFSGLRNIA